MRSKMLGLAIALSTFGLGVAATTLWIAYHTPTARVDGVYLPHYGVVSTRTEFIENPIIDDSAACVSPKPTSAERFVLPADVLDGKAISKVSPNYPPEARSAQLSGAVVVQVTVDECGGVVSARPLSGPSILQRAAVEAASRWRFRPTLVEGRPVKVSSTITFDFVL